MTRGQRGQRLWLEGGQRLGRGGEQLSPLRGALVQSLCQLRKRRMTVCWRPGRPQLLEKEPGDLEYERIASPEQEQVCQAWPFSFSGKLKGGRVAPQ